MGGRGSGGSRSGGGSTNPPKIVSPKQYYQEKYRDLNDNELNKALTNSRNLLQKENAKVKYEEAQLEKVLKDFQKVNMGDSDYEAKSAALDKQINKVTDARARASIRETAYYLAINEKNNVRAKQTVNDVKSMTNGQLNSFHAKSYRESQKARNKIETAKTKATRTKYEKLFNEHNANFNKAEQERYRRGLDGKGW